MLMLMLGTTVYVQKIEYCICLCVQSIRPVATWGPWTPKGLPIVPKGFAGWLVFSSS